MGSAPAGCEGGRLAGRDVGAPRAVRGRLGGRVLVVAAASVPLYLFLGRDQWFFHDDWEFLSRRTAGNFDDLMRGTTGTG